MTTDRDQSDAQPAIVAAHFVPIRLEAERPPISVSDLIRVVRDGWITIVATTLLVGLVAVAWAVVATPVYRSSVQVMPLGEDAAAGPLASLMNQVGGLASLVGFGGFSTGGQEVRALALLRSRRVLQEFIEDNSLLPALFPDEWDSRASEWRVDDDAPTIEDGYERFRNDVLSVEEDKQTGLVVVSVDWPDPDQAAKLANALIAAVNAQMRAQAIADAQKSISYLEEQLGKTELVPLRESMYRLIDAQLRSIMLANVRDDYGLSVIDPATPPDPDRYVWPRRIWMVIGGLLLGSMLGLVIVFVRAGMGRQVAQVP